MPIDVHAHYVPRQLIEAVKTKGTEIGVRLVSGGQAPAIGFRRFCHWPPPIFCTNQLAGTVDRTFSGQLCAN